VSDDNLLVLDNLAVGYGSKVILDRVNVSIPRGGFVGLVGPNGSGKTTLLKTVLGILPPLGGNIHFRNIDGRAPVPGYVPQRESLDSIYLLSGFEVALMGTYGRVKPGRGIGRPEREWTNQCLAATGVTEVARQRYSELSGGQRQRVLIARALATKPDLLVLDEPIAGIDATASHTIMELLRDIHAKQGMTILMVNHDLAVVRRYAQSVIWLHSGRADFGPVSQLLTRERIAGILNLEIC
jgi:manganese/zinc/iron transport system ATP- binding protein